MRRWYTPKESKAQTNSQSMELATKVGTTERTNKFRVKIMLWKQTFNTVLPQQNGWQDGLWNWRWVKFVKRRAVKRTMYKWYTSIFYVKWWCHKDIIKKTRATQNPEACCLDEGRVRLKWENILCFYKDQKPPFLHWMSFDPFDHYVRWPAKHSP
jgi:hypothetical protein